VRTRLQNQFALKFNQMHFPLYVFDVEIENVEIILWIEETAEGSNFLIIRKDIHDVAENSEYLESNVENVHIIVYTFAIHTEAVSAILVLFRRWTWAMNFKD